MVVMITDRLLAKYPIISDQVDAKELIAALTPHVIDQAVLTGKFGVFDIFRRG